MENVAGIAIIIIGVYAVVVFARGNQGAVLRQLFVTPPDPMESTPPAPPMPPDPGGAGPSDPGTTGGSPPGNQRGYQRGSSIGA